MKTARLIIGIVSFVLFFIILFQSCAAGMVNSMSNSANTDGTSGIFVGIIVIVAGIIAIVMRKSGKGSIVSGIFYGLAGIVGYCNSEVYKDLAIWGGLFIIFALFFIISGIKQIKNS